MLESIHQVGGNEYGQCGRAPPKCGNLVPKYWKSSLVGKMKFHPSQTGLEVPSKWCRFRDILHHLIWQIWKTAHNYYVMYRISSLMHPPWCGIASSNSMTWSERGKQFSAATLLHSPPQMLSASPSCVGDGFVHVSGVFYPWKKTHGKTGVSKKRQRGPMGALEERRRVEAARKYLGRPE